MALTYGGGDRPAKGRASVAAPRDAFDARPADTLRYYDDNAVAYAAATRAATLGAAFDEFVGRLPRGARVVDLGSGGGRDLEAFTARGLHAVGLDISAALATIARTRSGAPVIVADMASMPFDDGAFDGAWASASLLHLGEAGASRALSEARRVLRPGGALFTSMKRGAGTRREPCGRWFTYVEPLAWLGTLERAGFDVLGSDQQVERRPGPEPRIVPWLSCLARRR